MVEKNKGFQVGAHIVMIILSLCCIFPFLLLIVSSITDEQELIRNGYTLFPKALSLNAYQYMFKSSNKIISAYGITILSTVVGTVCGLSMTILMAYPLSRRDLPGRNGLAFYVFFTMLFSGGLVPTYIMYTRYIKVSNTIWALIIPSLVVNAFYVIMMRTYFSTNIPEAVIEAARIDGAGRMQQFRKLTLPFVLFSTMPVLIGQFIGNFNNFGIFYFLRGGLYMDGYFLASDTDLLINWLYNLSIDNNYYCIGAAISLIIFFITSAISLAVYIKSPSYREEDTFQ